MVVARIVYNEVIENGLFLYRNRGIFYELTILFCIQLVIRRHKMVNECVCMLVREVITVHLCLEGIWSGTLYVI